MKANHMKEEMNMKSSLIKIKNCVRDRLQRCVMDDFLGWSFLIAGAIQSHKGETMLAAFFILLGKACFIHADIQKMRP